MTEKIKNRSCPCLLYNYIWFRLSFLRKNFGRFTGLLIYFYISESRFFFLNVPLSFNVILLSYTFETLHGHIMLWKRYGLNIWFYRILIMNLERCYSVYWCLMKNHFIQLNLSNYWTTRKDIYWNTIHFEHFPPTWVCESLKKK